MAGKKRERGVLLQPFAEDTPKKNGNNFRKCNKLESNQTTYTDNNYV